MYKGKNECVPLQKRTCRVWDFETLVCRLCWFNMFVKPFPLSDSCHSMLIFEGIINQNVLLNKVNLTSILYTSKKSCSEYI